MNQGKSLGLLRFVGIAGVGVFLYGVGFGDEDTLTFVLLGLGVMLSAVYLSKRVLK